MSSAVVQAVGGMAAVENGRRLHVAGAEGGAAPEPAPVKRERQ